MLAAIILLVLTLYFWKKRKNIIPLLIPMLFITFIAITSLIIKTNEFYTLGNNLLFGLGIILILLITVIFFEAIKFYKKEKSHQ